MMGYRVMNLVFAGIWLVVAAFLLRGRFGPDQNAAWADPQVTDLYALVALAFVVWNVTRLYRGRRPTVGPNPLEAREPIEPRREEQPAEYHPEFDFTRNQDKTGG